MMVVVIASLSERSSPTRAPSASAPCRIVRGALTDDLDGWARQLDDSAAEHDSVPRRLCLLCVRMLSIGQLRAAQLAADAAALALLHIDTASGDLFSADAGARSTYQLQVHQATGIVQVQLGVPTEEALLMLRARAFALGRSLVDVATDVVARRLRFSVEDQ